MARTSAYLFSLFALCAIPVLVTARDLGNPFYVAGRVYCDTCRCGFETSATTYIHGARVRLQCRERKSLNLVFSVEALTDATGTYNIVVQDDHQDQICETVLLSSPVHDCKSADPGRDRATAILTRYNGVLNDLRRTNSMGFQKDEPLSGCTELLKQYLTSDE